MRADPPTVPFFATFPVTARPPRPAQAPRAARLALSACLVAAGLAAGLGAALPAPALAQTAGPAAQSTAPSGPAGRAPAGRRPLSAIDWLETRPDAVLTPDMPAEPPVADSAAVPRVETQPLGAVQEDAVGLLPASVTGFPPELWRQSDSAVLERLIRSVPVDDLPAMQSLLYTMLLAEALPPHDADEVPRLLVARIDRLLELGAVEPALALLDRAGPQRPELITRWIDAALLTGEGNAMCEKLRGQMTLAPDLETRIFCLARIGEWPSAAMTLESARALGALDEGRYTLMGRFLDPDLFEGEAAPPPPSRPSPLEFRLYEALGEPLPTRALPVKFAIADLSGHGGWRAQIEAAERLSRSGAISENRLLGIYTERLPAASGGLWDRVEALQRFETALRRREGSAVATALARVWPLMREAGLEVPFARLFGARLLGQPLPEEARPLALRVALLSPAYERAALRLKDTGGEMGFLGALARGAAEEATPTDERARAVAAGFAQEAPPEAIRQLLQDGKLGEAILNAMALFAKGAAGDLRDVTDALAAFRHVGLEDTARRAALQFLILGPEV